MSGAATIARALGGRASRDGFLCRCPVPDHGKGNGDRNPSLLVKDGDQAVLVKCFAGCDTRDVLAALRRRGLLNDDYGKLPRPTTPRSAVHKPDPDALEIWRAAESGGGTIVETYLRSRAITLPVPPSLRCGTKRHLGRYLLPIMLAAVQRPDSEIVAVHSTLLTTAGKKAAVAVPRVTTGALGFGAVRLARCDDVLGLAEGIETALSALQLTGIPCWASPGGSRMQRVAIPDRVRELHIFADNDAPGRAAAERAANAHSSRRVVLRLAPEGAKDWNDYLVGRARSAA
jgi:putative DNA primase/helicase